MNLGENHQTTLEPKVINDGALAIIYDVVHVQPRCQAQLFNDVPRKARGPGIRSHMKKKHVTITIVKKVALKHQLYQATC